MFADFDEGYKKSEAKKNILRVVKFPEVFGRPLASLSTDPYIISTNYRLSIPENEEDIANYLILKFWEDVKELPHPICSLVLCQYYLVGDILTDKIIKTGARFYDDSCEDKTIAVLKKYSLDYGYPTVFDTLINTQKILTRAKFLGNRELLDESNYWGRLSKLIR